MNRHQCYIRMLLVMLIMLAVPCSVAFPQSKTVVRPTVKSKVGRKVTSRKPSVRRKSVVSKADPYKSESPVRLPEPTGYYSAESLSDETVTVNGVSFVMKGVQGGVFTMGATSGQGGDFDRDEEPVRRVAVSSFRMGQTEVTQRLWQAVMGGNPSKYSGDNRPVENVSWTDCQKFITRLNAMTGKRFRLPTEAEWEYAARGGNRSRDCKYAGSDNVGDVAWFEREDGTGTYDVGAKQPNELDLYNMSGNVREWCQDWYGPYGSQPQANPSGPSSGYVRVVRGGSWADGAWLGRVSCRNNADPTYNNPYCGLRLVL